MAAGADDMAAGQGEARWCQEPRAWWKEASDGQPRLWVPRPGPDRRLGRQVEVQERRRGAGSAAAGRVGTDERRRPPAGRPPVADLSVQAAAVGAAPSHLAGGAGAAAQAGGAGGVLL